MYKGLGTALATPFTSDNKINFDEYGKIIKHQIDNKSDAIVVCGTTGEVSTIPDPDHLEMARYSVDLVKKSDKKIKVIAGSGGNDTDNIVRMAQALEKIGVDGLMITTPYYNKTSQKGLIEHFTYIASKTSLPIMLYNVPSRTGVNMTSETAGVLSKVSNITAIKEASSDITQIVEVAERTQGDMLIYCGNDDHIVPTLSIGAVGVVSTAGNVAPAIISHMIHSFLNGDIETSRKLQLAIMPLVRALFADVNPMPVKAGLEMLGFNMGKSRMPLTTISDDLKKRLEQELKNLKII